MMDLEAIMIDAQRDRDRIRRMIEQLKKAYEQGLAYRMKVTPIDADLDMLAGCSVMTGALKGHLFHALYQMVLAELEEQLCNAEVTLREAAMAFGQSTAPSV